MKTKITLIATIALLIATRLFAQEASQTFPSAGFKVKCGCNLYVNTTFIQAAKQQGANNIIAAYICAENQESSENGAIYNINVYDESAGYQKIKPEHHAFFEKKCLESYARNLSNAGYSYNYITYQGASALEYSFDQMGLPTKAIVFYKNKKSYLIQVATRNSLATKYNALKSSFALI